MIDPGLAGGAEKQTPGIVRQAFQVAHQFEVVIERLAESDSGIHPNFWQFRLGEDFLFGIEKVPNLPNHVLVGRMILHGLGVALSMHQNEAGLIASGQGKELGVPSGDVVDQVDSALQSSLSNRRFGGVERDEELILGQFFQNREDARQFILFGNRIASRTGAFSSEVNDLGALFDHHLDMLDGPIGIEKFPTVTEGIRGEVENAHHRRVLQ